MGESQQSWLHFFFLNNIWLFMTDRQCHTITVDIKGILSDANTAGTSKLDWRCFEYYYIYGNENLICENLRKIKKN